ncbi:MAG: hypothetical protein EXS29_01505 [Pedosphaera sp.]|nr:hypothetical protein [Pedosphaera sp.]
MQLFVIPTRADRLISPFLLTTLHLFALLVLLGLAACGKSSQRVEQGTRLMLAHDELGPTSTFEVRFDEEMVAGDFVGLPATESPLIFEPSLKGRFIWLSRRSGVFTPSEPFKLDHTYRVRLRRDLKNGEDHPLAARLERAFTTPALTVAGRLQRHWEDGEDKGAPGRVMLTFNAAVLADKAGRFLEFRDKRNQVVPAKVEQMMRPIYHDPGAYQGLTWDESFELSNAARKKPVATASPSRLRPPEEKVAKDEPFANRLVVRPARPLPEGEGWRLVVRAGLPGARGIFRTRKPIEISVGDVEPFVVTSLTPDSDLIRGRALIANFSRRLVPETDVASLLKQVSITPHPADLNATVMGGAIQFTGAFELEKPYAITISAGLKSADGYVTKQGHSSSVTFKPVEPRVQLASFSTAQFAAGQRRFDLVSVNNTSLHVRAKRLSRDTLIHALRGYQRYTGLSPSGLSEDDDNETARPLDYELMAGQTIFNKTLRPAAAVDSAEKMNLPLDELLGGLKSGAIFVSVNGSGLERGGRNRSMVQTQTLLQVTDLGLVWKRSGEKLFVHVFSLATGQPVPKANVRLLNNENTELNVAETDENGVAQLASEKSAVWLMAEHEEDLHALRIESWATAFPLHRFNLPFNWGGDSPDTHKLLLFTDRSVYRPGETVHLKGVARQFQQAGLVAPGNLRGRMKWLDARGHLFLETNVTFTAHGSVDASIALPPGALGHYRVEINAGRFSAMHSFAVQEYKPNTFQITLPEKRQIAPGEKFRLPLKAAYYFGKPLAKAEVRWSLDTAEDEPWLHDFDGFTFFDQTDRFDREAGPAPLALIGSGRLNERGEITLEPELTLDLRSPRPLSVDLLTEITDVNQQTISASGRYTQHSSAHYFGLRLTREVLHTGEPLELELIGIGADGLPLAKVADAEITLSKIEWHSLRQKGAGGATVHRNERQVEKVASQTFRTLIPRRENGEWKTSGAVVTKLIPPGPGQYVVEARGADAAGRPILTAVELHVTGEAKPLAWDHRNEATIALVPDRREYQAGDKALILVKTPIQGPALVTIERENVRRSFVVTLSGNAPSIEVPLTADDAPNIFVSVLLLRGAQQSSRQVKTAEFRLGYCQLNVTRAESKLAVNVVIERADYQPSQNVSVAVEVKDFRGQPTSDAEVTLYAVDEGVLSLAGYQRPDLHAFFFAPRPLSVTTSTSFPKMLSEDPSRVAFGNKGHIVGGGGDEGGEVRVRKNFLACAFWNARLVTDAAGRVTASFTAPDGLTRYRVFAVVHTKQSQFGVAESAFRIHKPLMIEPALARFANVGDRLLARAVVHNQTDTAGEIEVALQLDDKAVLAGGESVRRLTIPAKGTATLDVPVEFKQSGEAVWSWRARFTDTARGAFADAVQSRLSVGYVAPLLKEVHLSRLESGETNLLALANPQLREGDGTLSLILADTRLAELREATSYLIGYPYGCVEQTSSGLLPWILLGEFREVLPGFNRSTNEVRDVIAKGTDRLVSMQTESGGLGYWPGAREPMLWGSAYGGLVLAIAKDRGHRVPEEPLNRLADYLRQQLRTAAPGEQCLALYTLALLGRAEPAFMEKVFQVRETLGEEDRALLALAVLAGKGKRAMAEELLAGKPSVRGGERDWFGSPSRALATRLLAWCRLHPQNPMVDRLVTELLAARRDGHWLTTQGNAWPLLAITEYARRVEGAAKPVAGVVTWDGQSHPFELGAGKRMFHLTLPHRAALRTAPLRLVLSQPSRLFTQVKIETRSPVAETPRQDSGFSVHRSYERVADDGAVMELKEVRVGDLVRVTLEIEASQPAHYVAVDDALPAIFEAINPEFRTQRTRAKAEESWFSDFRELRTDRALFFRDHLAPGRYTIQYLARVRAAGEATAPAAKIEAMYQPERFGLSGTSKISSQTSR